MDYITVFIRVAIIFSLSLFAWLVIAGSTMDAALFRSLVVFLVIVVVMRVLMWAVRLITDNSHRNESDEQELNSKKSVSHG